MINKRFIKTKVLKFKQITAIITLGCFILASGLSQAAAAILDANIQVNQFKQIVNEFPIPAAIGRVSDIKNYGTKQVVINIQDLHCNSEVQRNISELISILDKKYNLKNVYVEGAYGNVNTSWLTNIKDKKLKNEIIDNLINQGKLTGGEYYSVISNRPDLLKGIEDEKIHKANIVRLGKILEKKEYFESKIKELDNDIEFMRAKYLSSMNKRFSLLIEKYNSGKIKSDKYYNLLSKYIKKINGSPNRFNNIFTISINNYPNVKTYLELAEKEKELKYKKISRQLREFVQELKAKLPYSAYNSLLKATDNFKNTDQLYTSLAKLIREYNLNIEKSYPDLNKFLDYTLKNQSINPVELVNENKRLVEEVRAGLSDNISELEVTFLIDFEKYFKNYLLTQLSSDDYEYFNQRFEKFKRIWGKYVYKNRVTELSQEFGLLNDFYQTNCNRNKYFLNNISELKSSVRNEKAALKNESISGLLSDAQIIVIVTGGFHSYGLKKIFDKQKISYLTITPNITKDTKFSNKAYTEFAKEQAKILSNALALGLSSQMSSEAMFALAIKAANKELEGINFTEHNIEELVNRIKEATGIKTATVDYNKDEAVIAINGRKIVLSKAREKSEILSQTVTAVNLSIEEIGNVLAVTAIINQEGSILGIQSSFLKLIEFATKHNIVSGDGLISEIAQYPNLDTKLKETGIKIEVLSTLPDYMQKMFFSDVLKNLENMEKLKDLLIDKPNNKQELKASDADVIMICGNDDVKTFETALELYNKNVGSKILISGGIGRLTASLIKIAETETTDNQKIHFDENDINIKGIETEEEAKFKKLLKLEDLTDKTLIDKLNNFLDEKVLLEPSDLFNEEKLPDSMKVVLKEIRNKTVIDDEYYYKAKAVKIALLHSNFPIIFENSKMSEAKIIKQIMVAIESENQDIYKRPLGNNVLLEPKSSNTPQNFENSFDLLEEERTEGNLAIENNGPIKLLYIQKPLQQFRTKATFNKVLAGRNFTGISYTYTPKLSIEEMNKYNSDSTKSPENKFIEFAIEEIWKIILYTAKGDIILSEFNGNKGLDSIPSGYWPILIDFIEQMSVKNRNKLMDKLKKQAENLKYEEEKFFNKENLKAKLDVLHINNIVGLIGLVDFVFDYKNNFLFGEFNWKLLINAGKEALDQIGISIGASITYEISQEIISALGFEYADDYSSLIQHVLRESKIRWEDGEKNIHIIRGPPQAIPKWDKENEFVTFVKDKNENLHIYIHETFLEEWKSKGLLKAAISVAINREYLKFNGKTREQIEQLGYSISKLKAKIDEIEKDINILRLKKARELYSNQKIDEARSKIDEELLNALLRGNKNPLLREYYLNCYYNAAIMKKMSSVKPLEKDSVQILLLDSKREKILLQKRGAYKRLFAGKYTVSANAKPKEGQQINELAAQSVKDETGLIVGPSRFFDVQPGINEDNWLISYDFYAYSPMEEQKLLDMYFELKKNPIDDIYIDWNIEKKALCVFSLKPENTEEKAKDGSIFSKWDRPGELIKMAEFIKAKTGVPFIYPILSVDHSSLLVCQLNEDEEGQIKEKAQKKKDEKETAQAKLQKSEVDITGEEAKAIDSDEMEFMPWMEVKSEFENSSYKFALDLTSSHFRPDGFWNKVFPNVINIDDPITAFISVSGGKGANTYILRKLMKTEIAGLNIPETSVITTYVYKRVILGNEVIRGKIKSLDEEKDENKIKEIAAEIRSKILRVKIPKDIEELIFKEFRRLGKDVSMRSSATSEDLKEHSFAGQGDSFLHVITEEEVINSLKGVWASLYNEGFLENRKKYGFANQTVYMAVLMQKMIHPKAAGVVFTIDANQRPVYEIEAQPGLGEGIVGGEGKSDRWIAGFMADTILERSISEKTSRYTISDNGGITIENISESDLSKVPSMNDDEVLEVARIVKLIHRYYMKEKLADNIDVEYVMDTNGMLYIVQTRAKGSDINQKPDESVFFVTVVDEVNVPKGTKIINIGENSFGVTYGVAKGILQVLDRHALNNKKHLAATVKPGVILVTHHTNNEYNGVFSKLAGVITTDGGTTSHAAQNSQPHKIPCLVGATDALVKLKDLDGQFVSFDVDKKRIYVGDMPTKTEERKLNIWIPNTGSADLELKAMKDMEPHEVFSRFIKICEKQPGIYMDYSEDGHLRKRSSDYRLFQLDYYYKAWDILTKMLNDKFRERSAWVLKTQFRLFKGDKEQEKQYRNEINITRNSLFQRVTDNNQGNIFYFIRELKDLKIDDLQDLFNDRWKGIQTFASTIERISVIDESNVEEIVDSLVNAFMWMHIAFWMDVAINHIFSFDQFRYVNKEYIDILKEEAIKSIENNNECIDPARKDLPNGNILKISRLKDKEIYLILEKIWRDKETAKIFIAGNSEVIEKKLKEKNLEILRIIESWSMRYKATSEHLDEINDTQAYLKDIAGRVISLNGIALDFIAGLCFEYIGVQDGAEFLDLNKMQKTDNDLYIILRSYARIQVVKQKYANWEEMKLEQRVDAICDVSNKEINEQIKSKLMEEIVLKYKENKTKVSTARSVLKTNPNLAKISSLSHQEFLLREDGHHLIVPLQRILAEKMLEVGEKFKQTGLFSAKEKIFDISTDEFIALFKTKDTSYIKMTFERTKLLKSIEYKLTEEWKYNPEAALYNYEEALKKVLDILDKQINAVTYKRVKKSYIEEKNRLLDRVKWLNETVQLLKIKSLLNSESNEEKSSINPKTLVICSNDTIDIFEEAAKLYCEGKINKIIISEGGQSILHLIQAAFRERIPVWITDNEVISHENHVRRLELLNKQERLLEAVKRNESDIISQIIQYYAGKRKNDIKDDIVIIKSQLTDLESYLMSIRSYAIENDVADIVFMNDPLSQLRTKLEIEKLFKKPKINTSVYGIDYRIHDISREHVVEDIVKEIFNLIICEKKNNISLEDTIPNEYWQIIVEIINQYKHIDKIEEIFTKTLNMISERNIAGSLAGIIAHWIWDARTMNMEVVTHIVEPDGLNNSIEKYRNDSKFFHAWITFLDKDSTRNTEKFKNAGFKISISEEAKNVWVSVENGVLIYYIENMSKEELCEGAAQIISRLKGTDKIKGDEGTQQHIRGICEENKIKDCENIDFVSNNIVIDHTANAAEVKNALSDNGINTTIVVSSQDLEESKAEEINLKIRKEIIKYKAKTTTLGEKKIFYIDNLNGYKDIADMVSLFNKAGNGEMLVDWNIFKTAIDNKEIVEENIKEFLKAAKRDGVLIHCKYTVSEKINASEVISEMNKLIKLGFAEPYLDISKMSVEEAEKVIQTLSKQEYQVLALNTPAGVESSKPVVSVKLNEIKRMIKENEVIDLEISEGLSKNAIREGMKRLPLSNVIILHSSNMQSIIKALRGDVIDQKDILSFINILLNFGKREITTEEKARRLGYDWDNSELPELDLKEDIKQQIESIVNGNDISTDSAIYEQIKGLEEQDKKLGLNLKREFLQAIAEKALILAQFKRDGNDELADNYVNGKYRFDNPLHEEKLGSILLKLTYMDEAAYKNGLSKAKEIQDSGAETNLNDHLIKLMNRVREEEKPELIIAVKDIILEMVYSELQLKKASQNKPGTLNVETINKLLKAA